MSTIYKTVLIAGGTGGLGEKIALALLDSKHFSVKILSRVESVTGSKKSVVDVLVSKGASLVTVKDESVEQAVDALTGSEVVISVLNGGGLAYQLVLIEAAKKAGVKLFIPSDFGIDIYSLDVQKKLSGTKAEQFLSVKVAAVDSLKKHGLDHTEIVTDFFTDTTFWGWLGFDWPNGKVVVPGDGNAKVTFTHRDDIAKYVVQVLLQADKTKNRVIRLAGDTKTYNEVVSLFEKALGKKLEVTYRPESELRKGDAALPNALADVPLVLQLAAAVGAVAIPDNEKSNDEFPDVKPVTVAEYISSLVKP
mmetsp:Transcript_37305/g.60416  ORF Transcript_37305/g.60416 Transcript_37305/m.60416 type:complete len:307 (+) Transcript_37305:193-1113(+)